MSAPSAKGRLERSTIPQSQLKLDGAAPPATASLSSHVESVTSLASALKLSIELHVVGGQQWLHLILDDDLNLQGVEVNYPVMCTTLDRAYHLRESTVIGVRRLLSEAFASGLISDYPGALLSLWNAPTSVLPEPTPTLLEDDFGPSLTDLESL